jgi:inner membrane protein COX18
MANLPMTTWSSIPSHVLDSFAMGLVHLLDAQQALFITIHHTTLFGDTCPWWASLVLGTILVRSIATLPLAMMQQKSTSRLLQLQPMLKAWQNTLARQLSREAREKQWHYTQYNMILRRQVNIIANGYLVYL